MPLTAWPRNRRGHLPHSPLEQGPEQVRPSPWRRERRHLRHGPKCHRGRQAPTDSGLFVMALIKGNLAPRWPSLAYHIVPSDDRPKIPTIQWEGLSTVTAETLFGFKTLGRIHQ